MIYLEVNIFYMFKISAYLMILDTQGNICHSSDLDNIFLGSKCKRNDYVDWELASQHNVSDHCLLGRHQVYERRRENSRCYNGYNYDRPIKVSNCQCTREDYQW